MEVLIMWVAMLFLGVAIGSVLGWLAFFQVRELRSQVARLTSELARLRQQLSRDKEAIPDREPGPAQEATPAQEISPVHGANEVREAPRESSARVAPESAPFESAGSKPSKAVAQPFATAVAAGTASATGGQWRTAGAGTAGRGRPVWLDSLIDNWMIWLGGISVALAGIFMVKYGIDTGLLGPGARIIAALLTGTGLHVAAEWLRRRTGGSDPVFASLAGGASITLYGALLAALHLYQLLDPRWTFLLLAAVSLATMALSLLHGPLLAIIGLIGAYVVPILVSNNSGNIVGAMVYSLIISSAALLLLRYVYRPWLWWGLVAGSLGWWLISLTAYQAADFRGLYLALLAWGLVAIPAFDWLLQGRISSMGNSVEPGAQSTTLFSRRLAGKGVFKGLFKRKTLEIRVQLNQATLCLVILAWAISIYRQGFTADAFGLWAPLVVVIGLAARRRDALSGLPWLTLAVQWLAWLLTAIRFDANLDQFILSGLTLADQPRYLAFAGMMALLYSALAALHLRARGFAHGWFALALLAPLAWLASAWLLVNGLSQSLTWSLVTLMAGATYALLTGIRLNRDRLRQAANGIALWLTLGAHCAYSLAVTMYFREAGLSLALAAQLLSLSWLMQRYPLPWLGTIIKVMMAVVVTRLTFNPWLLSYPTDVHWSLWTYGGATLFCALAARQCRSQPVMFKWLSAATLHLLVLTLGAEVRYWLYDGAIFVHRYSLTESAINGSLWAAMALTYCHRAKVSENLGHFYRVCSRILLALATASYGISLTLNNPWWSRQDVGATPVFNILLLAYGLPVLLALLVAGYHERRFRRPALGLAGLGALVFVTLEIRHLWQDGYLSLHRATSDGELYTYSVIWLVMAIAAILAGAHWRLRDLYKAGMALLAVVIAKIFLVDMSDLQGLWRVASFMGLGLTLLALAWLHRRIHSWPRRGSG